jgi:hypothetical protein
VVLVSRVDKPSRQKVAAAALDSISRNTESQQSREPDKLQEKGSTVAKEMLRRQMTRCSRIHCVQLCTDNCMRQSTARRDLSEISFGMIEPQ